MHENNLLNNISFWFLFIMTFLIPIFLVPVGFISTQFGTSILFASAVIVALILYVEASVIDPTDARIFFQLSLLKYNIKDFSGSITALEKAVTLTPDYANAKYFLGLAYESVVKRAQAITQFEASRLFNPHNKQVETILNNLLAGKSIFTDTDNPKLETARKLPIKEN